MRNIRIVVSFLLLCLGHAMLLAQTLTITGKVVDEEGLEVIGANIRVKGNASVGTITGLDGAYSIRAGAKDVLQFSFIGMATQNVPVKGRTKIDVQLKQDNKMLDEVVVIGYGTSKRSDLTGSVVSVKSDDLMKTPTSDVTQALAGRVAGVQVTQSEGGPGSSISIRVRGGISITQSNEPLYVIDGFPSEDGMAELDPGEIESIDILKDASATAIYGARGANGVVVITTKNGGKEDSRLSVSFDSYIGFAKIARKLPVLSSEEFVTLDYERNLYLNGEEGVTRFQNVYGSFREIQENYAGRGIDWQEEVLGRTTTSQNYRVNISGGNKNTSYSLGYAYFKNLGAMVYSGDEKHNVSLNLSHKGNKRLSVNARVNFTQSKVYGMGTSEGNARFNKMEHILQSRPVAGINGTEEELLQGEDPLYVDDESNPMQNPLISAQQEQDDRMTRTFQLNGGLNYRLGKRWFFRSTIGTRYQILRRDRFYGELSSTAKRSSINGSIQYSENGSFQTSNVLNYEYKTKKQKFTAMWGQEWVSRWTRWVVSSATNFPNNDIGLDDMSLGTPGSITSNVNYDDKLISFFSRLNYNWGERYLLTATIRADGSSKFSKKNRYGYFPSGSLAWNFMEEEFMKPLSKVLDAGKLRASWGLTGNNRIGEYEYYALLQALKSKVGDYISNGSIPSGVYPINGSTTNVGTVPTSIGNSNLKWETTEQWNVGLDLSFFKERLNFTADIYRKTTRDLLLEASLPLTSGFYSATKNIGKVRNDGLELSLNTVNIQTKDFTWSTDFNIAFNKNEVLALSEGQNSLLTAASFDQNYNSQPSYIAQVGLPMGMMYGYIYEGTYKYDDFNKSGDTYTLKKGVPHYSTETNTQPGMPKYKDVNGDGIIDSNDRTIIGRGLPIHTGGFTNNFTYKGFDLSVFFQWSYGNDIMNANRLFFESSNNKSRELNQYASYANRWTPENPDSDIPAATTSASNRVISSRIVEDGSFLRLKTVTLGYTFPKTLIAKAKLSNARVYIAAQNLWTWTSYSGYDPEVSVRNSALTPGLDFSSYPRAYSISFGVNLGF